MSGMRKAGVWTLGAAVLLWIVLVLAVVTTPADEGANIGAGMLFMLAVPCTVTGVVLVAAGGPRSFPQPSVAPSGPTYPGGTLAAPVPSRVAAPAAGNAPARWGLALGITGFLVGWTPFGLSEAAYFIGLAVSVALSLAGAALGWLGLQWVRAGRAGDRGLALAALIVGLASVGVNSLLIVEGVALFLL